MKPKFGTLEKLSELKTIYTKSSRQSCEKQFIKQNGRKLLNFSSNDYLGIKSGKMGHAQFQSSSRLVSGNDTSFSLLEKTCKT